MTDLDINKILIAWMKLAIGLPAFRITVGNQKGKEPVGSFATILAITSTSVGIGATEYGLISDDVFGYDMNGLQFDQGIYSDGAGLLDIAVVSSSVREVDYSVNFYRTDAHDNMRKLMHFLNTNTSKEFLFSTGVSIFIPDTYRNLDDLEEDGYIKRAQMDLRLHCISEYVETVNAIDEFNLTIGS